MGSVARQVANHSVVVTYYIVLEKLKVIMKKAILALLVISTVTILAHADKPKPVETTKVTKIPKPVEKVPNISKPVGKVPNVSKPVGKVPKISTRPLKPRKLERKYPIYPSHFKTSRPVKRLFPKFPIHKALSNSVRNARKFKVGPLKKQVKKIHKRKRVQKPIGQARGPPPVPRRPHQVRKVHNFARFLRAFGKQLNRPVVPVKNPRLLPKISNNRRKFKLPPHGKNHPIVFKKAEDIAGYEKFTLSEVVFPEAKSDDQVKEASERVDNIETIFEDEVKKVEVEENKIEDSKTEEAKSEQKLDVDPRTKTKKLDVR